MSSTPGPAAETETTPRVGGLIRALRRRQDLTLQDICSRIELSVGHLSQIERDLATPSLGTLARIAQALGVGIEYFVAVPRAEEALSRSAERPRFSVHGSSILYERLSTDFPGSVLSSFLMTVPPGYRSETVAHDGEEIILLVEGEIVHWLDGQRMILHAGDALHFRSSQPHAWANPTERPARLVCTVTLSPFSSGTAPLPGAAPAASPQPKEPTP